MPSINEYQSLIRQLVQEKTRIEVEYSTVQNRIRDSLQLLKDMGFSSVQEAQQEKEKLQAELESSYKEISSILSEIKNFNFKKEEPKVVPPSAESKSNTADFGDLDSLFNI